MLLRCKQQQLKPAKQQLWPVATRRQLQLQQQLLQHEKRQQSLQQGLWPTARTCCHMQLQVLQRHR
jgi:hypothetical protein